jgi:hypothetical protein
MAKKHLPTIGPIETNLPDRTFERTQGCWNCVSGSRDIAKSWWSAKRQKDLEAALAIALQSPMGEKDPKVTGMRDMIDRVDRGVASGGLVKCVGGGMTARNEPVGDLVVHNYLCVKWSGKTGASVARAGEAPDLLPEELEDKN